MNLKNRLDAFENDFLSFSLIENKRNARPDIHAFLLLDEIVPPEDGRDMISAAEHDQIFLATDCDALNNKATDAELLELVRCGVMYDEDFNCLSMFV